MFALHLCLSLISVQLVVLVSLQMVLKTLLNNLLHLLLNSRWICDGFLAHYLDVIAQFDLRQGCRHQAELHFLLLVLLFVQTLHSTQPLLLLFCQMNGYHHFVYVLNVLISDLLRMLDVVSDLIYVDVTVFYVLRWKPSC